MIRRVIPAWLLRSVFVVLAFPSLVRAQTTPGAASSHVLTEEAYVERVLSGSLDARVLEAEAALERAEGANAGAWPNPSVGWEREPNPTETQVVGGQHVVYASVPLVLSGRLEFERDAAAKQADAVDARRTRARAQLWREAKLAFASVLAAREQREILERSVSGLDALSVRANAGTDAARLAYERGLVADGLRAAKIEEGRAQAAARRLLAPSDGPVPEFAGTLATAPAARLDAAHGRPVEGLAESRGDLRALALELESARLAASAAARSLVPEPTLSAGALLLEGSEPGHRAGLVIGVSVPLPLFDRAQDARARARARGEAAQMQRAQLLHKAKLELEEAQEVRAARRERLSRHRDEILEPARALGAALRAEADIEDAIDADRVLREATLLGVELKHALHEAEVELLFLSGALDGALNR